MFRMTTNIDIGKYLKIPVSSCEWRNSITEYCNTAKIVVPNRAYKKNIYNNRVLVYVNELVDIGTPVVLRCGYDGNNKLRFKGFIARVEDKKGSLVIHCEGYTYQLRKQPFNKIYNNPKLKTILQDLVSKSNIKLSNAISDITLSGTIDLSSRRKIDVLEYLVDNCKLSVSFKHETLYVGLRYVPLSDKGDVKFKVDWNTISIDSLSYSAGNTYKVIIKTRENTGQKIIVTSSSVGTELKIDLPSIKDKYYLQQLANDIAKRKENGSYTGSFKAFLEPFVEPYDVIELINKTEKTSGRYLVDSVNGSFSINGGRQEIVLGLNLPNIRKDNL